MWSSLLFMALYFSPCCCGSPSSRLWRERNRAWPGPCSFASPLCTSTPVPTQKQIHPTAKTVEKALIKISLFFITLKDLKITLSVTLPYVSFFYCFNLIKSAEFSVLKEFNFNLYAHTFNDKNARRKELKSDILWKWSSFMFMVVGELGRWIKDNLYKYCSVDT